ncbi:translation initiation factor IF-2 subunit alpha [Candidatus Micrarchaeota archaeon]|nr:translation initiation factor IF-2 subunit alpha [Candidatus Micrarchaeota archaeon]
MNNNPELNELVVATVRKVMPVGAICALDEYGNAEAFVHVSEVTSGWVRNIREHLKEGQKIVAKIVFIDRIKNQVDLSVKRVSEGERKRKLQLFQAEKKALKLLELSAKKIGKTMNQAWQEAGNALLQDYEALFPAFEALSRGEELKSKLPKTWLTALKEVAAQEIKPKSVSVRALLTLKSFESDGLHRIKTVLDVVSANAAKTKGVETSVLYVSAPNYYLDVTASDYKTAEKALQKTQDALAQAAAKQSVSFALEKQKT